MRIVGVVLLLGAGGLAWLTMVDRMSPLALSVVEWESRIGFPLASIVAIAGVISLIVGMRKSTPLPPASPTSPPPGSRKAQPVIERLNPAATVDWVTEAIAMARALPLEDGARIKFDEGSGIPFTLHLERLTPEVERRSLDAFSGFLSTVPTPQRVKVVFIGSNATGVPRQHAVKGSLRRVFHAAALQVIPQQNWVDVLFFEPDPCWENRPFLFLDQ